MTPHSRLLSSLSIFPSIGFLHSYLLHHTLSFLLLQLHFAHGFKFLRASLPAPHSSSFSFTFQTFKPPLQ